MEKELSALVSSHTSELSGLSSVRQSSERTDILCGVVRSVIRESDLRVVGGVIHYYDGRVYVPTSEEAVRDAFLNVLSDAGVKASDLSRMGRTPYSELRRRVSEFDRTKVVFSNAVYDVVTGEVSGFSPDFVTDYSLGYAFDDRAGCLLWQEFLDEVLPDRYEQMCLQEFFGMCFVDRSSLSIEKMALLVGSGANGKSVVCEVIRRVLGGDGMVDNLSPDQLQDSKQVVSLSGKVLNIAPDVRKGASFDSALKALVSSQTVKGWMIYSGSVEIKCPPLLFALNEMPCFRDTTSAFFRRILFFRFDRTIPPDRQDRGLADRLVKTEACGIFLWVMEGARRLRENLGRFTGCDRMDAVVAALEVRIRTEQSPVLQYLDIIGYGVAPVCEGQRPDRVPASSIYDGIGGSVSKSAVTRELRSYGVQMDRGKELRYHLYRQEI